MDFGILGPLEIRQDGNSVAFRGTKQRLLLAALLLQPNEVVSSDRLIEALWGEDPPPTAAKALQVHVSQLRRVLAAGSEGEPIVTRPPGYELRIADDDLDLQRFETMVSAARAASVRGEVEQASALLHDALDLWRGAPLADLTFEQFLQPEIARLEELRLTAIEDRIDADLAVGLDSGLIGELEQLTSQHPVRERLRGQLMLALYRSGRQAEALEAYRATRRELVEELGIEPSRQLKDLERRILAQDSVLDVPARDATVTTGDLIGRERELAALMPVVERALHGSAAVILVAGEPGIGKSRLAETLAAASSAQGARVAVGRCWEAGGAPSFWPWVQALRACIRDMPADAVREAVADAGPAVVAILPELADSFPASEPQAADSSHLRFQLFDAITRFLGSAAAVQPLALVIDDLHAADVGSLLALRFIAGGLADARVLIVGCYRDTEAAPELTAAVGELARQSSVHRITLAGLAEADVARLLDVVVGEPAGADLAARVHAETRGNPLFAGEIARLLASAGPEASADGALPIPDGVRDAIGQRLERQSEACRSLLTLASILGREFDLQTLVQVGGLDDDALLAGLEEATAARLIGAVPGTHDRFRFAHILVRDTLYDSLSVPRRLRLHLAVGRALEELHGVGPTPHAAELAHHFLAAGSAGADQAAEHAVLAGDAAAGQYGFEEAARYYGLALELIGRRAAPDPARSCKLLLALGEVQSRAGKGDEAKVAYARAAAIAADNGWSDRLGQAALGYVGRFPWVRASADPALVPLLERALEAVGDSDPPARAKLLARLAGAIRDDATRERRVRFAEEALAIARRSDDPLALAYALEGYWVASEGARVSSQGVDIGNELIALAEVLGDKERAFTGHDFLLNALWKLGDRAGVDVELETLTALADDLRQPAQRWYVSSAETMVALTEGRFDEAEALIVQTRTLGEGGEAWNAAVSERLQLFVLRRAQGRLSELADSVERAVHEYPSLFRFRSALAHVHAELGDRPAARAALDELLLRDIGGEYLDAEWLFGVSLLPRVASFLGDADAAACLYALLSPSDGLYTQAPIEATFGSTARVLGTLAATLERYDAAERHFEAAIESERRMRARPWLAHAQHELALTLRARATGDDERRARRLLEEGVTAYESLGMPSWAARARAGRP